MEDNKRTKEDHKVTKAKIKYSKFIVAICIIFIMIYTITQLILSYILNTELSPTLTTCVYAFFGSELASCAFIKIFDIRGKNESNYRDISRRQNLEENINDNQNNLSDG